MTTSSLLGVVFLRFVEPPPEVSLRPLTLTGRWVALAAAARRERSPTGCCTEGEDDDAVEDVDDGEEGSTTGGGSAKGKPLAAENIDEVCGGEFEF